MYLCGRRCLCSAQALPTAISHRLRLSTTLVIIGMKANIFELRTLCTILCSAHYDYMRQVLLLFPLLDEELSNLPLLYR